MPDMQLSLLASELRTRAKEILVRATNTADLEVQKTIRAVAADYQKLVQHAEQRVREAKMKARVTIEYDLPPGNPVARREREKSDR